MNKHDKKTHASTYLLGRDYNMVSIINGATKAGVHKDRKKEQSRKACRGRKDWE